MPASGLLEDMQYRGDWPVSLGSRHGAFSCQFSCHIATVGRTIADAPPLDYRYSAAQQCIEHFCNIKRPSDHRAGSSTSACRGRPAPGDEDHPTWQGQAPPEYRHTLWGVPIHCSSPRTHPSLDDQRKPTRCSLPFLLPTVSPPLIVGTLAPRGRHHVVVRGRAWEPGQTDR
jgi:hypothetical protein